MREHRGISSCRSPNRTRLAQIPWSKGTVCSLSRNKDKGDVSILKGTCYIIRWSGDLFISPYPQSVCAASGRHLHRCRDTPVQAGTLCGLPPQPPRLNIAATSDVTLPSQRLCQRNPQRQAKREEEKHIRSPADFLLCYSFGVTTLGRKGRQTNHCLGSISRQQWGQTGTGTTPFHRNTSSLGFHQALCHGLVHHVKNMTAQVSHPRAS